MEKMDFLTVLEAPRSSLIDALELESTFSVDTNVSLLSAARSVLKLVMEMVYSPHYPGL